VVIAGCGGSSAGTPLAAPDSATLRNDIGAIRTAAGASNPTAAHAAVTRLRADVTRMRGEGRLSPADAQSILLGTGRVDSRITAEVSAPVKTVTSAPPTASTPAPAQTPAPTQTRAPPAHPHPKGKDHATGHGGGKDGGD
jgi:hypothetical protein